MSDPVGCLVLWPLLGALAVSLLGRRPTLARLVALAVAFAELWKVCAMMARMPEGGWTAFESSAPWIPSMGISWHVGLDGLSAFLVFGTALLTLLVVLGSWTQIQDRPAAFHAWLLVLESALVGTFAARDLALFYVFWEAVLIPMYFLIGIWGGPGRLAATTKFVVYTAVGSLLMLAAILAVAQTPSGWDFDLARAIARGPLPGRAQTLAFLAFALAFAIKVPLFPFHTWLPQAHVEAPTGGSVLLAGILLKMGVYGFLRLAWPLFPDAAARFSPALGALAVTGILYGSLMALAQSDLKKLVAYSSVAHLGFCVLGLASGNRTGALGASFQMLSHAVTTGALFFLVGMLYERGHSREIGDYGGLARRAPRFAVAFGIVVMASIGVPGLSGFPGELSVLAGAFLARPLWAVGAAGGVVLGAVYLLGAYQRIAFGPVKAPHGHFPDLTAREILVLLPLLALAVGMGLMPGAVLERLSP